MPKHLFPFFLLSILLWTSCSNPLSPNIAATVQVSISSTQTEEAKLLPMLSPTPFLTPMPVDLRSVYSEISGLRNTRTIIFNVSQTGDNPSQPISNTVEHILTGLGLEVVQDPALSDGSLTISMNGTGVLYTYDNGIACYTKAEYDGLLEFGSRSGTSSKIQLEGDYMPLIATSCPKEPSDAPFELTWPEVILEGFCKLWGPWPVVIGLEDENSVVRRAASSVLGVGECRPPDQAIPAMIQALIRANRENDKIMANNLASLLRVITDEYQCQTEDPSCFQAWWEKYQYK